MPIGAAVLSGSQGRTSVELQSLPHTVRARRVRVADLTPFPHDERLQSSASSQCWGIWFSDDHCNCFAFSPSGSSTDRSGMLPWTPCSSPSPLGQASHPPRRPCAQGSKPLPQQNLLHFSNKRLTVEESIPIGVTVIRLPRRCSTKAIMIRSMPIL